jgi:tetratricopeptide (TPR) repeat protein
MWKKIKLKDGWTFACERGTAARVIHFIYLTSRSFACSLFNSAILTAQPNAMISKYDSDSDADSFKSFDDNEPAPPASETNSNTRPTPKDKPSTTLDLADDVAQAKPIINRFDPEEEAKLLTESNDLKGSANQLFGKGSFENAIQTYDRALASCPNYLDYEIAVLRSNVAACHLKLQEWKEAVESATKGVDCLERLEPLPSPRKAEKDDKAEDEGDGGVVEVDEDVAERIERLNASGHTINEVRKLQIKLLLRRAKGRSEQDSWTTLQGADEDYRTLLHQPMLPSLSATDKTQVVENLQKLTPRLEAAKTREMAEMMDKLKGLGNSILKPFGLSTENFQFVKDEKTGGYSMNFNQGAGKK